MVLAAVVLACAFGSSRLVLYSKDDIGALNPVQQGQVFAQLSVCIVKRTRSAVPVDKRGWK
jgi:hypothetical protein